MIYSAAADYLSRASTRRTCGASHVPRPVAARSRKWGSFVIGRKTIKKRMLKQLQ